MTRDRATAIPSTLVRRTPATRLTWALRATCVVFVLWSVLATWRTWSDQPVRATALAFFQALIDGRNEQARNLIAPEIRQQLPATALTGNSAPLTEAVVHVTAVHRHGVHATVDVTIERAGYKLTPTAKLERQPDQTWLLTHLSGIATDPRWESARTRVQAAETESLVDELEAALTSPDLAHQ